MTPEKRATLTKVFMALLVSGLLVGGYITKDVWLAALLGT